MPRPSYYAPVGNPVQLEKQPSQPLEFDFLYTGDLIEQTRETRKAILSRIVVADLAALTYSLLIGPTAYALLIMTSVGYGLLWAAKAGEAKEYVGILRAGTVGALALVFALLGLRSPWLMLLLLGALLGVQTYGFGSHWIHRSTTAPLPRAEAQILRRQWRGNLIVVSLVPLGAAFVAIFSGTYWLFPAFLLLFCLVQHAFCQNIGDALRMTWRAFSSWCAYNAQNAQVPGLMQSPAGSALRRQLRLVGDSFAFTLLCLSMTLATAEEPAARQLVFMLTPGLAFTFLPLLMLAPLLEEAARQHRQTLKNNQWQSVVTEMRESTNSVVRDSYFLGNVASDGSPFMLSRSVFNEPAHFLGSTGAGKTSKGLAPWIEQTIGFGDCSLIVVDLKADTLETLATMIAAEEALRRKTGKQLPLKLFSSQNRFPIHGFNPLGTDFWNKFSLFERTDILCGALGLIYGADYGEGYYTSANAMTCYETLRCYPNVRSFRELAERCRYVLTNPKKFDLLPNTAKNADHLYSQLRRLADYEQLQIADDGRYPSHAVENAIDMFDVFQRPQMLYLHLSTSLGMGSAPALARLFAYILLTAASMTERRCRVYLVIDEFQRMVADNLEYIMQLARSMDVGLVLANQSMADLQTRKTDMTSIVETNCRFRQWFDVPSEEDRRRLVSVAGETIEHLNTTTLSHNSRETTRSYGSSEVILPRLNINEMLQVGDDPDLSIVRVTRGAGYAQFRGFPTVIRSGFHISQEEYERRKAMKWPAITPGMFIPADIPLTAPSKSSPPGPKVIREVDGKDIPDASSPPPNISDLFTGLSEDDEKKDKKRKRRPE